jgi:hypothetical protein
MVAQGFAEIISGAQPAPQPAAAPAPRRRRGEAL